MSGARTCLFALLAALPLAAHAAPSPNLAVVDVQGAMEATDHWKKVSAELTKVKEAKQKELEAKQGELRKKKEQLDAQRAISDPKAIDAQEEELMKGAQELTQGFMKTQQELSAREKKLTEQMLSRIETLVRELAVAGDYDIVFEKGPPESLNVVYLDKAIDLTAKVIEQYKQRFKDKPLEQ